MKRIIVASALVFSAACRSGCLNDGATDAIVALKAIQAAETEYASIFGHYDSLGCLVRPTCSPNSPASERFLDPDWALNAKRQFGYRFEFSPGPGTSDLALPNRSKSAMTRYAVAAIPAAADVKWRRGFCVEETGTIYQTSLGTTPRLDNGRCVNKGIPIQ